MGVRTKVKAVFLDRDGVLNEPVIKTGRPYPPNSISEVRIMNGVREGLKVLRDLGYVLTVITNQPDVARGTVSQKTVESINEYIKAELCLDDIYSCIHDDTDNCSCRKPKPGMIFSAAEKWNIDLTESFLIGDRWKDIAAGRNAGVKTVLIQYGYDEKRVKPDFMCYNFSEAVMIIKSLNKKTDENY